jgi:transcriptional antiterminator NusG
MDYAHEEARKEAEKGAKFAMVEDKVVFGWLIHYFEEDSIEGVLYNEDGTVDESAWYSVRNVQSVIGFLGGTNHPAPLSKQEIVSIFRNNNTNEQEAKPKISFEIGETVRIINGAFESFEGTITDIDIERQKLKLNVSIFVRSTPVELEFWQVERTV